MIDRDWIVRHIPHAGAMCLLDSVASWDEQHITCRSTCHRQADHPLAESGRLGVVAGIELAAQAMAVHSALLASDTAASAALGYLTSIREVRWISPSLNGTVETLLVRADRISGTASTALYTFALVADGQTLIDGRLSVVLNAAALGG